MNNETHGHEVLHLMMAIGKPLPRMHLKMCMEYYFGHQALYITCRDPEGLTADGLIDAFTERGRIQLTDAGYLPVQGATCHHSGEACHHHHHH
ncbi:MAG: DUF2492 family protein [Verrucomicrobiota bacterium JB022]|nr:DUF2492 family protein [Verrucomicrobiota bacterium JB022]